MRTLSTRPLNRGWRFVGPRQMRRDALISIHTQHFLNAVPGCRIAAAKRLQRTIEMGEQPSGAERWFISDECIIGSMRGTLVHGADFYARSAQRMRCIRNSLPAEAITPLIVMRDYCSWAQSAYLRLSTTDPVPPPAVSASLLAVSSRGWEHVVEDACDTFGSCVVIDYDLIRTRPRHIFDIIGIRVPNDFRKIDVRVNTTSSRLANEQRRSELGATQPEMSAFKGQEILEHLHNRYQATVRQIEADSRCRLYR